MSSDLVDSLNIIESYFHLPEWRDWINSYKENIDSEVDEKVDFDTILKYICDSLQLPFEYVSQEFKGTQANKKKKTQLRTFLVQYFKDLLEQKIDSTVIIRFNVRYIDDKLNLFFEEDSSIGDIFEKAKGVWMWADTTATFSPSDQQIGNALTIDMSFTGDSDDEGGDDGDSEEVGNENDEEDKVSNQSHEHSCQDVSSAASS